MRKAAPKRTRVALFGHFAQVNWGNEASLQAMLHHLGRHVQDADITCICTGVEATRKAYRIAAVPISLNDGRPVRGGRLGRFVQRFLVGVPTEPLRWIKAFRELKGTDLFIVPGTGLLTDAFGLMGWGPYNLFKWSLMARLRRSRVIFVSIGAGPLDSSAGRWFARSALSLADYRSYRDQSSLACLRQIDLRSGADPVCPDLAFSLPDAMLPRGDSGRRSRRVVGLGVMSYAGEKYSTGQTDNATQVAYLGTLATLVAWLLAHEYDVRFLIGDELDRHVIQQVKSLVRERSPLVDDARLLDEPASSLGQLLSQIAETDMVVATRFHNVLLALLLEKPVVSISFHHKCESLMRDMGLAEYCHDFQALKADELIASFQRLGSNAESLKPAIRHAIQRCRTALDEQYAVIFGSAVNSRT